MSIEEIRNKIRIAVDAVQNVPEPLKVKAFEIVLNKMLSTYESAASGGQTLKHGETNTAIVKDMEAKLAELAHNAGISIEQLKDVFNFEVERPVFIGRVNGKESEKQFHISRLVMLAFKDVYGREWIEGSILSKILKDYGVGSLDNLARNLTAAENEVRAMGQTRDRKYKLTETGRQNALTALKQLVTG